MPRIPNRGLWQPNSAPYPHKRGRRAESKRQHDAFCLERYMAREEVICSSLMFRRGPVGFRRLKLTMQNLPESIPSLESPRAPPKDVGLISEPPSRCN